MKYVTILLGLATMLPLVGCADAESVSMKEETVSTASAPLVYGNVYDVKKLKDGVPSYVYGQEAINALLSWGMPLAVDEYCKSDPSFSSCVPTIQAPRPAWLRLRTEVNGAFGSWIFIKDWNELTVVTTAGGSGVPKECMRLDIAEPNRANNWWCKAGAGGPGGTMGISAYYGQ